MRSSFPRQFLQHRWRWWLSAIVALAVGGVAAAGFWLPEIHHLSVSKLGWPTDEHDEHADSAEGHEGEAGHAGHDHDTAADKEQTEDPGPDRDGHERPGAKPRYDHEHDEAGALVLSKQAKANIGMRVARVELRPFERTITVPGMVVERPGWSTLEITAPMTGVVTRTYPIQGEAVKPGQPLFEVRLTHEDLLQKQTEFLRVVEELDVIGREIERLEKVAASGAISGKSLLERQYEQQKQQAALRVQRQSLLMHGLSEEQVEKIVSTRLLLQNLTVRVPDREGQSGAVQTPRFLQVQELKVSQGTYLTAGTTLCLLVDHAELYLEGKAFEQDTQAVSQAASQGWAVSAELGSNGDAEKVEDLKILFLDDKVNPESRVFCFYVSLPNRLVREDQRPEGRRFVYWRFKPGQRLQIKVPVEKWTDRIVLPVEALAQDGAEFYVFEANGDHFDRRAVHVEYRDETAVVIAHDGALRLGTMVAESAAHQMQLALKNKAGGGVDPHAGHNH
jgi:membrane fusion protein, heavy metal efflux system